MARYESANACWNRLAAKKTGLMERAENYATLTIRKLLLPESFDKDNTGQTHDYQSIGAQAVNHVTNKLMLSMFRPSAPFFRVAAGKKTKQDAAKAGLKEQDIGTVLAKIEREASATLDTLAQRPKLYSCIRHLVVVGNVLLFLDEKNMRVMGLRYFCVKRDYKGRVHTLIIKETMCFDELAEDVQAQLVGKFQPDSKVDHFKWLVRQPNGDYKMTQWVNAYQLPKAFNGQWSEDDMPYRVLTWDLGDDADYGTGLVEEYEGDFEAVSAMAEATIDGGVAGTEYRWMVSTTGTTSADDLNKSKNGSAIPGSPEDVNAVSLDIANGVRVAMDIGNKWEQRIARGFLMLSGVVRESERTTAEEVRLTAQELETAYGGVYSALAASLQRPVAFWLLEESGFSLQATDLQLQVLTGLDALSRNGDLEALRLAFNDLAMIAAMPPEMQARVKFMDLAHFVGDGRGIDLRPFIRNDEELQQWMAEQQAGRVTEATATAAGEAAATSAGQQ